MARVGLAHRGGGPGDAGQGLQRGVDLTELDAPTPDLDLVVGAAHEEQALGLVPDEVAAAVRPPPPQRGHGGELLGVLDRVEVAGQADATDDELTDLALVDRLEVAVDHRQVPTVEGQADPHGHPRR